MNMKWFGRNTLIHLMWMMMSLMPFTVAIEVEMSDGKVVLRRDWNSFLLLVMPC
jgi:hypothetical protein